MAIIRACQFQNTIRNTGKECDMSMGPTAMLIAIRKGQTFTDADLTSPSSWLNVLIHASRAIRVFPFFGQNAPIREITNDKEADVIVTLDDGSKTFLRYGFYTRTFGTTSGSLGYAKSLQGLNKSGYSIIEIDQQGNMLCRDNGDGTYSGLVTDLTYSPAPTLPDMKTNVYKNHFLLTYSPLELVNYGVILEGAQPLLSAMGLIDAHFTAPVASSTTDINVAILTNVALSDLVAMFGTAWNHANNFVVTDPTGTVVTVTGVTQVAASGTTPAYVVLAGTFVSGTTYTVNISSPAGLLANNIDGYDVPLPIAILIP